MKKYINPSPIPNGGMPLYAGDFIDCLQSEVYRAIIAGYQSYEQSIIVSGCKIVGLDLGQYRISITAGVVFLNGELLDVPAIDNYFPLYIIEDEPEVVSKNYKDQQARPVTVRRKATWVGGNDSPTVEHIAFNPFSSQHLKDVQRRETTPPYAIQWFPDIPQSYVPGAWGVDSFNESGLGIWEWRGFAIANGQNGTSDMRGRVPAQFNPNNGRFGIGATLGSDTVTLTINQMPRHSHPTDMRPNKSNSGSSIGGQGTMGGSSTGEVGGGQAHDNMQPTIVGVWVQRLMDLS